MTRCIREALVKYREEFRAEENKRRRAIAAGIQLERRMSAKRS